MFGKSPFAIASLGLFAPNLGFYIVVTLQTHLGKPGDQPRTWVEALFTFDPQGDCEGLSMFYTAQEFELLWWHLAMDSQSSRTTKTDSPTQLSFEDKQKCQWLD